MFEVICIDENWIQSPRDAFEIRLYRINLPIFGEKYTVIRVDKCDCGCNHTFYCLEGFNEASYLSTSFAIVSDKDETEMEREYTKMCTV